MNAKSLKCPFCDTPLDDTRQPDVFFCKRCQRYIMLEDILESVEANQQNAAWEREEASKTNHTIRKIILIACAAMLVFALCIFDEFHSNMTDMKLQQNVNIAIQYMNQGKYAEARSVANQVRYTADSNKDKKEKWDDTRKQLLKDIDKAEKEAKKAENPGIFGWFGNDEEPEEPEIHTSDTHGFSSNP